MDYKKNIINIKLNIYIQKIKQNKYGGTNYTTEDMINRRLDHLRCERSKRIESEKNINNLLILGINHRIEKVLINCIEAFKQKSTKVITETELESLIILLILLVKYYILYI